MFGFILRSETGKSKAADLINKYVGKGKADVTTAVKGGSININVSNNGKKGNN